MAVVSPEAIYMYFSLEIVNNNSQFYFYFFLYFKKRRDKQNEILYITGETSFMIFKTSVCLEDLAV